MTQTQTEEEKVAAEKELESKELMGRVEQFNKELIPLLGKYELGLGASAFMNGNGTIGARPIMFDARKKAEEGQVEAGPVGPVSKNTTDLTAAE